MQSIAAPKLSTGTCALYQSADQDNADVFGTEHIMQILSVKKVDPKNPNASDRYRLIISDSLHFMQAMLATQLNYLVTNKTIDKNVIVALEKCSCNVVQGKRLVIIINARVIGPHSEKIGSPTQVPELSASDEPVAQPAAQPQQQQRQQPAQPQQQASKSNNRHHPIYPIEGLSPYQNKWTIKARVTNKSDMKTYSNAKGDGKFFTVTLMDETTEIRGTGFNAVADDLYDKFQEGKVYFVSNARVNLAKKKFSNLPNDYELGFERNTEVEECLETTNVPMVKYNFAPLSGLNDLTVDAICDVIGIVKEVGSITEITSRQTNRQALKRELTIVDKSGYSARITLWGRNAEKWNAEDNAVVAFKGLKVGDFGGRSLSTVSSSAITVNPELPEAFVLRGWYDSTGAEQSFQAQGNFVPGGGLPFKHQELMSIEDVKTAKLGENLEKAEPFCIRGTVMHIKTEDVLFPACPRPKGCGRKVVQDGNMWRCDKCDTAHEQPEYRYRLNMALADFSGQGWFSGFDEAGLALFGIPGNELKQIRDGDESEYGDRMLRATTTTFNLACRARTDTYNDNTRVKYQIDKMHALDYREETRFLVERLHSAWAH